ncbi:zinc-ribbon domain-containing protein [Enterovirga sp.]|uniref:zinc-ribbon domain-containing protein n=1 Tax=Enterovirga sp. TaxID=2026350 RepID=UPI002C860ADD|nr:zinc-ribbon domain-containing protein [Enterovirga sp.]HMO28394.1 zinc-ribbon domain-containing protein [Enterovirga sp.]
MLITCPSCSSTYDLPAGRIGAAGRKVRCASCRESWFIASPGEESSLDRPPGPESGAEAGAIEIETRPAPPPSAPKIGTPPPRRRPESRPHGTARRRWPGTLARAAALAAICAGPPALLAFRESVVAAMPGTASLYRGIGLPVNLVGLSFAQVRSTLTLENTTPILEVTGEIVNDGRLARSVPWLQIALTGEGGETLYKWSAQAAEGKLKAGETAPFRLRLTAPPTAARKVEVMFREDKAIRSASR